MIIDHETLVFFDASCLIAAARSPNGGAGYILSICVRGYLRAAVSQGVQAEIERNTVGTLSVSTMNAFERALMLAQVVVIAFPPLEERISYLHVAGEKDEHVVAAAVASGAPFLLTLDRGLLRRVNLVDLGLRALTPGEFLNEVLPLHHRYDDIRG